MGQMRTGTNEMENVLFGLVAYSAPCVDVISLCLVFLYVCMYVCMYVVVVR